MKIFFATDAHAAESTFRKFTNAGPFYKADMVIYGGDFCGKMVVPIVKTSRGTWEATYYGSTVVVKDEKEIPDLQKTLRDAGFYYIELTESELNNITKEDVERITKELQIEQMSDWAKLMDERFKKNNIPCVVIPGNDDPLHLDDVLAKLEYVQNGDGKVVEVNGFEILSLGYSNPTIFKYPRDISEEELAKKIDELASQVKDMNKCIFVLHAPPYDTDLDQDTLFDEDLNPILDGDELATGATGSKAVRAAIEKYQPMLSLHGHVHASRGISNIGRTVCVNPGSNYDEIQLRGVLVEVDSNGSIRSTTLTSG
ncbi:MAG: metallophosphoesterase [Syntrophomonadaceae bacterium]|nr:metallophosphoesterase [Syntrophomonadaceae bacterium]MDD3890558.1 metallophosphoesterase [Syntrophomonadaceae bacterium]MDD4548796.1 metallophosphoesterase [Syntrophomonadaceae bacterium]